jgi:predicted nucleic acid-binding protein
VIFIDTNVLSESFRKTPDAAVMAWLTRFDAEIALSTIVIGEIAYGIAKIRTDERAPRLSAALEAWRSRFAGRIFAFDEEAALTYGEVMGGASRRGRRMTAPDGMIAAIALSRGGRLATRNAADFEGCGLTLIDPWAF